MNPHYLLAGLWFYSKSNAFPWYIANINNETAQLNRKVVIEGKQMTDSRHLLFYDLEGIPLSKDILEKSFGFTDSSNEGYMYKELYPPLKVLRGDVLETVKQPTYLYIDIDDTGKRFTTFISCGENKIYISELSFAHELQLLIFSHTYKFPIISITQTKQNETPITA